MVAVDCSSWYSDFWVSFVLHCNAYVVIVTDGNANLILHLF
jgi:hypothetical protein